MKLEVNKNHKKANLKNILLRITPRRIKAGVTALFLSATLVSGIKTEAYADDLNGGVEYSEVVNDVQVVVEDGYNKRNIYDALKKPSEEKLTVSDLQSIKYLSLQANDDLSFLKYCTNLESIAIKCSTYDGIQNLSNIPSLNSLNDVSLNCYGERISKENASFLINSPNIRTLHLGSNTNFEDGVLSSMDRLDTIELFEVDYGETCDMRFDDFKNIKSLKNIKLRSYALMPLDLAVSLDTNTYNELKKKGVKFDFGENMFYRDIYGKSLEQLFIEANSELDRIVESLNVSENASDIEKYNKALLYVIENLSYDEEVASAENSNSVDHMPFYDVGNLQGALMNDTAICGNYAALLDALCRRLGLDIYYVSGYAREEGERHAWNLVKIDDEYYYADPTWFDSERTMIVTYTDDEGNIYDNAPSSGDYTMIMHWGNSDSDSKRKKIEDGTVSDYENYLIDMKSETRNEDIMPIEFENGVPKSASQNNIEITDELNENAINNSETENINETDTFENNKENVNEEKAIDITNKKFKLNIAGKVLVISAPVLIAVLSTFGLVRKKQRDKQRRIQMMQDDYLNLNFDYSYSDNNHDNSYYGNSMRF